METTQGNCTVCTGEAVVENGVCRNCGAGKVVDQSIPKNETETSSNESENSEVA